MQVEARSITSRSAKYDIFFLFYTFPKKKKEKVVIRKNIYIIIQKVSDFCYCGAHKSKKKKKNLQQNNPKAKSLG